MRAFVIILGISCLYFLSGEAEQLKIGAFNVQIFGKTKFNKADVVDTLSKIVSRYDVILIQEIRDASMTVIYKFLDKVNNFTEPYFIYDMKISERLGRTRSKEQYAFLYREDKIRVEAVYQYEDPLDLFEREPYSVLLTAKDIPPFFLVAIRTKPTAAFEELNALDNVYDELVSVFNITNGIILGDMNADCRYLSKTKYEQLDLVKDTRFTWLINSTEDTTTATSDCSYDRIIMAGDLLNVVTKNGVFKFDEEYGLELPEAKDVSDHYPVEVSIKVNHPLKVCAFNVQVFGKTKFSNSDVVNILIKIVHRCDVILIQEIRDVSETIIHSFLELINRNIESNCCSNYSMHVSQRLGRTRSKEQYAFLYRTDKVNVLEEHQFSDPFDKFEREPYSILISTPQNDIPPFFLVAIHIKPTAAFEELNALDDVYDELVSVFNITNGIILGDMNADCRYLSQKKYQQLDLVKDTRFTWLINSTEDTTTTTSDCSYDRIVIAGDVKCYIVKNSAGVVKFDMDYELTSEEAQSVSDHYPVQFQLQGI